MNEQIKTQLASYMKENGFYDTLRIRTELEGKREIDARFDDIFGDSDPDATPEVKSELLIAAEEYNNAKVAEVEKQNRPVKVGDAVRVLNHTRYQHLSHGTTIEPKIAHELDGYETTIRAIWKDEMEDDDGDPVIVYTYETATGEQYNRDEIELI